MAAGAGNVGNIEIHLPVQKEGYRGKWDSYGVEWRGSFDGNPVEVLAALPAGWSAKKGPTKEFGRETIRILDGSGMEVASIWRTTESTDRYARVKFFELPEAAKPSTSETAEKTAESASRGYFPYSCIIA